MQLLAVLLVKFNTILLGSFYYTSHPIGRNLFDAYDAEHPGRLDAVDSMDSAISYVLTMLKEGGILCNLFYDPLLHDPAVPQMPSPQLEKDDLRRYAEEVFTRFLLSLAYDMCEDEGDATARRALRRAMVLYFLASNLSNQGLKYPYSTLIDLIVEESSSERTRARFDNLVTVNLSGRFGDGLWHRVE